MAKFDRGNRNNPKGGRPPLFRNYLRRQIGEVGEKALDVAWEIAQGKRKALVWHGSKDGPIQVEATPNIREQLDAAMALVDHLNGKPKQALEHSGEATSPVLVSIGWQPPEK